MTTRTVLACVALAALAACNRGGQEEAPHTSGPQLEAPAPEVEPTRPFAPANAAAQSVSGPLTVSLTTRMPDAQEADRGVDSHDVLTLTGANHLVLEAEAAGSISPNSSVQRQALRALMTLPTEASSVLLYKVTSETKPEGGQGVCGGDAPAYVVVWEPETPGETALKILPTSLGAPGAAAAHACPLLEYARQ